MVFRILAVATVFLSAVAPAESVPAAIATWTPWEQTLTSHTLYATPYQQVTLAVNYTAPDGRTFKCYGFWDGGATFKIRFMFPAAGTWKWQTTCSDTNNGGLHHKTGTVNVINYAGDNPLYRKGYLKVSANRRYLVHANGDPFLWIGDTPWSAFVAATQAEWEGYLKNRAANKFTVVQVHCGGCSDWIGRKKADSDGNTPFVGNGPSLQWNPVYWQQVERKVQAANEHGLLVYICAVRQPGPGFLVDDARQVERFAQCLAARFMGRFVAYSPIADDLGSPLADAAGRALRETSPMHLISAHPRFFLDAAITFHGKHYVDFAGVQTGEGWTYDPYKKEKPTPFSTPLAARNAIEFPLALYHRTPPKPVINQEGPYDHPIESGRVPLPPRKAGYWSFLSGAAGHTYGCFGVWNWGVPIKWFPCYDHKAALDLPSVAQMKHLSEFFGALPWWTLEPCHELVQTQPDDWVRKMALAKSDAGDLAVAYLPDNTQITIDMRAFPMAMAAQWFNPITGEYHAAAGTAERMRLGIFSRPDGWEDALLVLTGSSRTRQSQEKRR